MTEYLNQVVNPAHPWGFVPDTEENIIHDLQHHTLDPSFENYGNFVNRAPTWIHPGYAEKYKGCTCIFGNFLDYSHAFRVITDDQELIARIEAAVRKNQSTKEYQEARRRMIEREQQEKERQLNRGH